SRRPGGASWHFRQRHLQFPESSATRLLLISLQIFYGGDRIGLAPTIDRRADDIVPEIAGAKGELDCVSGHDHRVEPGRLRCGVRPRRMGALQASGVCRVEQGSRRASLDRPTVAFVYRGSRAWAHSIEHWPTVHGRAADA